MVDKDKVLQKLRSMNKDEVAAIVEEALLEMNEGWVECKNCTYLENGECWLSMVRDGCYHGEPIEPM